MIIFAGWLAREIYGNWTLLSWRSILSPLATKIRAIQVYDWLWKQHARSFDEMSNLFAFDLRKSYWRFFTNVITVDLYATEFRRHLKIEVQNMMDICWKALSSLQKKKYSLCFWSQIGCSLSCKFCATGMMERKRNLDFDEIYDQVILNQQSLDANGNGLTNIVYMGMGWTASEL